MQNSAYIRLCVSLVVCFSILLYNFCINLKPFYTNSTTSLIPTGDGSLSEEKTVEKEEKTETQSNNKETSSQADTTSKNESKTESVAVSAQDIKGKILEKYVSPYNAAYSYDKVYMKNLTNVKIDIKKLLNADLSFKTAIESSSPQVLIVHTHATESFMTDDKGYYTDNFTPRSRDNTKNMVKIGETMASYLNSAGIKTLHSKTQHDYPEYTGSYSRAAETIRWYLKKYPSIKVVLDLHRDSISDGDTDKAKLVTKINGKKAAQVMLVMGSQTGSVSGHPNWQENLKLAFKLQQNIEKNYPTLARPLMLASKLYNQHLTKGSLLIEFGTDANTLSEAVYSAELVAVAIAQTLKEG